MSCACDHCAKPVKGEEEAVSCMAFCNSVFHLKCVNAGAAMNMKLNKSFLNIVHNTPNLFWMCNECVKLMKCARFKPALSSFGSAINSITERQEIAHAELRKELTKQGQQIAELSKRIVSTPTNPVFRDTRPPASKRPRSELISVDKPLVGGTKPATDANVLTVPEPTELFWLYLSRIHPSVKPESIEKLVKTSVQCDDPVKVVPLVKRGTDTSRMNFISYKVGMAPALRDVALNPDTWPTGVLFREFEDLSSKNTWLPHPNTPTITISPVLGPSQFSTPIPGSDQSC